FNEPPNDRVNRGGKHCSKHSSLANERRVESAPVQRLVWWLRTLFLHGENSHFSYSVRESNREATMDLHEIKAFPLYSLHCGALRRRSSRDKRSMPSVTRPTVVI